MNYEIIRNNSRTLKGYICNVLILNKNIMKNLVIGMVALLFTLNSQAQNQNVKSEIKTTVTTNKDSKGVKETIKTEEVKEVQNIEFKDSNTLNKDLKDTPVQVTTTTKITENGVIKVLDVDHSAYYNYNGIKYQVTADKGGYNMFLPEGQRAAILRKTSNNNYIYSTKNGTSYGYFDTDGNLILETYDIKTDNVTTTKYIILQK